MLNYIANSEVVKMQHSGDPLVSGGKLAKQRHPVPSGQMQDQQHGVAVHSTAHPTHRLDYVRAIGET